MGESARKLAASAAVASPDLDALRAAIAVDLVSGVPPGVTCAALIRRGVPAATAAAEVSAAAASPYTRAGAFLRHRMNKLDWDLGIQRRLSKLLPDTVERRHKPPSAAFLHDYYAVNRPIVITGAIENWPALTLWGKAYFAGRFGDRMVDVQTRRDSDPKYEIRKAAHLEHTRFGDFVERVYNADKSNDFYLTASNDSTNRAALAELWEDLAPLPEYLDERRTGGFLWFGPRGTITPFHHDITNNFMAQIIGRKHLLLAPPCYTPYMYNNVEYYSEIDGRSIDYARFPDARGVKFVHCEIGPGDLLFLPVGWWHFVEALDVSATLTITNFRWDNGFYDDYPRDWA